MTGLDDLRNRLTNLRNARGVRRYYADTFDDGVQAALDQFETWIDHLEKPSPTHPDSSPDDDGFQRALQVLQRRRERRLRAEAPDTSGEGEQP